MNEEFNRNGSYAGVSLEVKEENVILGTIGALIGALAGAALIMLLAKVGYVASICGVVMAYLSLFLYTKFAGKLSKKGIVICVVIMLVTVFVTEWLATSYAVYEEWKTYGISFGEIFKNFFSLLKEADATGAFAKDLLMLYGFTALGAVPQIKKFLSGNTEEATKPADMTLANGNTVVNTTETIDSDLMNGENSAKKFDEGFFN